MEKKKDNPYTNLGVLWPTFHRFLRSMRGDETQDSFLNKLLDLYDEMDGTKTLQDIEKKQDGGKQNEKKNNNLR
jgi:hypothetical protein